MNINDRRNEARRAMQAIWYDDAPTGEKLKTLNALRADLDAVIRLTELEKEPVSFRGGAKENSEFMVRRSEL